MTKPLTQSIPSVWVLAHPFGNIRTRDNHKQWFDAQTDFHDGLITQRPASYYHNWNPDTGEPIGKPTAIGIVKEHQYKNPETGAVDGRWDKVEFFDNVDEGIKKRLLGAIDKGTLRASPSVVPDFHKVESSGHIKDWLPASIAVFDAEGYRQPVNKFAIGIPVMKALWAEANLEFPEDLKGTTTMPNKLEEWKQRFDTWMKAAPIPKDPDEDDEDDDDTPDENAQKTWDATFGSQLDKGANAMGQTQVPDEIRLEWDKEKKNYADQMKAMRDQVNNTRQELDRTNLGVWFDDQMKAGRVLPAERQTVIGAALQFKSDDDANLHPNTMKAEGGATVSRLKAYQQSIESRQPMLHLDEARFAQLKAAGLATPNAETEMTPARRKELLGQSPVGEKILADEKKK